MHFIMKNLVSRLVLGGIILGLPLSPYFGRSGEIVRENAYKTAVSQSPVDSSSYEILPNTGWGDVNGDDVINRGEVRGEPFRKSDKIGVLIKISKKEPHKYILSVRSPQGREVNMSGSSPGPSYMVDEPLSRDFTSASGIYYLELFLNGNKEPVAKTDFEVFK